MRHIDTTIYLRSGSVEPSGLAYNNTTNTQDIVHAPLALWPVSMLYYNIPASLQVLTVESLHKKILSDVVIERLVVHGGIGLHLT